MTTHPTPLPLAGKRAVVTGGSRGIGAGIAARLQEAGATVVATARNTPTESARGITFVAADLTTLEGARHAAHAAHDALGGIDIVVHNVGGAAPHLGALAIPDEAWLEALNLNLLAAVRLNALLAPAMREQGSGAIVHISSAATPTVAPPFLHYTVAKAALENYGRGLALELAPAGIRVNTVSPGRTATPGGEATRIQWAELTAEMPEAPGGDTTAPPLGRDGQPADIANAVLFLVSDQAAWVTGSTLIVDGGEFPKA